MIDCHAHLACPDFDGDRDAVRARAHEVGVEAVLVVGEDHADNERVAQVCSAAAVEAAEAAKAEGAAPSPPRARLLPCFGLHPDRFCDDRPLPTRAELDAVLDQIRVAAPGLAAIGEVGLDRWRAKEDAPRRAQAAFLEELVALSLELDLPLNVHSRSAGRHTLDLLIDAGATRVLMHAFDGKAKYALRGAEAGFLFSIPPSIVRSPQKQKLARALPLEALTLESDSPVLGPEKQVRNEPANLAVARDEVARLKGLDPAQVAAAAAANARRLFPTA